MNSHSERFISYSSEPSINIGAINILGEGSYYFFFSCKGVLKNLLLRDIRYHMEEDSCGAHLRWSASDYCSLTDM